MVVSSAVIENSGGRKCLKEKVANIRFKKEKLPRLKGLKVGEEGGIIRNISFSLQ